MSEQAIATSAGSAYETLKPALRQFVDLYLNGEKGTDAMRAVRPALKRPDVLASKWLARIDVKAAIAERRQNLLEAAGIHQEMVIRELGRIAFGHPKQLLDANGNPKPLQELDADAAAMVAGFEFEETRTQKDGETIVTTRVRKVKRWDKRQALRDLASIGGFDKSSENGGGGNTIFNIQINL